IALFSAGGKVSEEFAPSAVKAGCFVIDNSSHFRMDKNVSLIVPEVNGQLVSQLNAPHIIANPNCSTIQMLVALSPLHRKAKIKRIIVSTYQASSGAGKKAVDELLAQTQAHLQHEPVKVDVFPHQLAFNCIPQIDIFLEDGSTKEEWKMVMETKKIFDDNNIQVVATAVRVPVLNAHSESITVEFHTEISVAEAKEILSQSEGLTVIDDTSQRQYPLALEADKKDNVFVGRIRRDATVPHGLSLWVVADNLRKGAALNAVQIAELLLHHKYFS
ncbi:MAG: aspartate-semialdehyde dehydrogenase, partial [Deltaproteobacteria bacterium CG_4_10_14_0_2_um_filter_43_8]